MPTNTYVAIDSTTLTSAVPSVTFSNLGSYTDIRVVVSTAVGAETNMQFNGNSTGSLYSATEMWAGTTPYSERAINLNYITLRNSSSTLGNNMSTVDIMNYSNSTTFKTVLISTNDNLYDRVYRRVGLWRNTNAITSITFYAGSGNLPVGSTFSLYGIKSWSDEVSPKATGGYVYEDSSYWYHAFPFSSTFTPSQSITADYVIVAGGGGGGGDIGGGGGAGGLRYFASQSLSATSYTITVGAGGTGGPSSTNGNKGSNTSAFGNSATGGGYGARYDLVGGNGGSGGGSGRRQASYQAGNEGGYSPVEGYAGAAGSNWTSDGSAGGGGGAGGAAAYNASGPSNGGVGFTSSLITDIVNATNIGQLVSGNGYLAGGGGGGSGSNSSQSTGGYGGGGTGGWSNSGNLATQGQVSTGSGGGGGANGGGVGKSGGSGVVIVRYAK